MLNILDHIRSLKQIKQDKDQAITSYNFLTDATLLQSSNTKYP